MIRISKQQAEENFLSMTAQSPFLSTLLAASFENEWGYVKGGLKTIWEHVSYIHLQFLRIREV